MGSMTQELLAFAHSYASEDLPLVLVAMKLLSNAMLPVLDDSGRQLMDHIMEHTTCITIKKRCVSERKLRRSEDLWESNAETFTT